MSATRQDRSELSFGETLVLLRRTLEYLAPFKRQILIKIGLAVACLVPALILPWPVKIIIDHVIGNDPISAPVRPYPFFVAPFAHALAGADKLTILLTSVAVELFVLLLMGAYGTSRGERNVMNVEVGQGVDTATRTEQEANYAFSWAGGLVGYLDYRFTMRLTQRINHHYRSRAYERLQSLPMTALDDERIGDAVYRVMYDTTAITQVCYRLLVQPFTSPINILMIFAVLVSVYGKSSPVVLTALLALPTVLLVSLLFAGLLRGASAQSRAAGSDATSAIEEGLGNMAAVQSLGGTARERTRFDRESKEAFRSYRRYMMLFILTIITAASLGAVVVRYVFLDIGDQIIAKQLSVGDIAVLMPYFGQIATSSVLLGAIWMVLQDNAAGLSRVFWLMDQPSEIDPPGAATLPPVRESVKVEHVGFAYPGGPPVLEDVSFEARRGELTAFVGPAGTGKTTLAYLIPRFLKPTRGRVLLDGRDIADVSRASLRSQIAFVFQETTLLDSSIAANLRLSNPNASLADLTRATQAAGIYDFIQSLPEGFETRLGRAGSKLSGGQKQRLSIARALLSPAPIVIFDEPTSALDPETEAKIVQALEAAARDRIVIVIAHRLSTVRNAAQILFLQDGRVIERGSHRTLLAAPHGAYRRFVQLQTQGS